VTVFTSVDRTSNSASGHLTHYSVDAFFVDQNRSWFVWKLKSRFSPQTEYWR